jgi:D-alanyl-D-alanine carboxypeptidase
VNDEQTAALKTRILSALGDHVVQSGFRPVKSILLGAENAGAGLLVREGVGVIGRSHQAVAADFQFNVASITKPFVAAVILQLVEEDRLQLKTPIVEALGGLRSFPVDELLFVDGCAVAEEITVDRLLQHRSGLGDIFIDTATRFRINLMLQRRHRYTPEGIMQRFFAYGLNQRAHSIPGAGYFYSDINYVLLGLAIERVTGESLHNEIRRRILDPLGMEETYLEYREPVRGHGKRVDSYFGPLNMTRFVDQSYEWAGGGLVSTTDDLLRFVKALLAGRLFSRSETLPLMLDASANLADGKGYGRGIMLYTVGESTYYGHGGYYGSLLMGHPDKQVFLAIHMAQAVAPFDRFAFAQSLIEIVERA